MMIIPGIIAALRRRGTGGEAPLWGPLLRYVGVPYTSYSILTSAGAGDIIINGGTNGWASRSQDGGLTWYPLTRGLGNPASISANIRSIATDENGTWIAVFSNNTASISTDNGDNWAALPEHLNNGHPGIGGAALNAIATDKNGTWVCGGWGGYASISTNNGVTWTALPRYLNSGFEGSGGHITAVATDGNGIWVAGLEDGFTAVSTNNGATWGPGGLLPPAKVNRGRPTCIVTDGNGLWFAGLPSETIGMSTDNGATWTGIYLEFDFSATFKEISTIATDGNGGWMVAGLNGVGAFSPDNGATWITYPQGLNSGDLDVSFKGLYYNGEGRWMVFGGSGYPGGPYGRNATSPPFGPEVWGPLPRFFGQSSTNQFATVYTLETNKRNTWMSVADRSLVSRSTDGGENWEIVSFSNHATYALCSAEGTSDVWISVGVTPVEIIPQIWRSTDDGETFSKVTLPDVGQGIIYGVTTNGFGAWVAVGGNTLSSTDNPFILRSTDDGITWTDVTPEITNAGDGTNNQAWLSVATNRFGNWLACDNSGAIIRSTNNGASWSAITPPVASLRAEKVVTDRLGNWLLVTATSLDPFATNGRLFRSTNNGTSWVEVTMPTTKKILGLASDSVGTFMATTYDGESYISYNGGASFTFFSANHLGNGNPSGAIWAIAADTYGMWMAAGNSYRGSRRPPLPE